MSNLISSQCLLPEIGRPVLCWSSAIKLLAAARRRNPANRQMALAMREVYS